MERRLTRLKMRLFSPIAPRTPPRGGGGSLAIGSIAGHSQLLTAREPQRHGGRKGSKMRLRKTLSGMGYIYRASYDTMRKSNENARDHRQNDAEPNCLKVSNGRNQGIMRLFINAICTRKWCCRTCNVQACPVQETDIQSTPPFASRQAG